MSTTTRSNCRVHFRIASTFVFALLMGSGALPAHANESEDKNTHDRIERLADSYVRIYRKHIESKDPFVRALSAVAMGRIDAQSTTDTLLVMLQNDHDPIVRVVAWEVLHARADSLNDDQYRSWVQQGIALAEQGQLGGRLLASLVRSFRPYAPESFQGKVQDILLKISTELSHRVPRDVQALMAFRELLAEWRDRELTQKLVIALGDKKRRNNAEYVLGGLHDGIEAVGSVSQQESISDSAWRNAQRAWERWLPQADLRDVSPGTLDRAGSSDALVPQPEKVIDPGARKWAEALELSSLKIRGFDLVFCIDSTGSMKIPMQWVARSVSNMLEVFGFLSQRPRIGATYFRHEVLPELMLDCCRNLRRNEPGPMYRTESIPLTNSMDRLARLMLRVDPTAGNCRHKGGACHGGLFTALKKQPWTRGDKSSRVIVIVGDSTVTPGSEKASVELATEMHERGWKIHAMVLRGNKGAPTYESVAKAGGGQTINTSFLELRAALGSEGEEHPNAGRKPNRQRQRQVARIVRGGTPYARIVEAIVASSVPVEYRHLVTPLVRILLERSAGTEMVHRDR